MSPLDKLDHELEAIIRELTLRIVAPRLGEFEGVWEVTNRVCDRYEILGTNEGCSASVGNDESVASPRTV
jgi:hypothetical protein